MGGSTMNMWTTLWETIVSIFDVNRAYGNGFMYADYRRNRFGRAVPDGDVPRHRLSLLMPFFRTTFFAGVCSLKNLTDVHSWLSIKDDLSDNQSK